MNMVALLDGRIVSTWSNEWRIECLERSRTAKRIADLSTLYERREAIARFEEIHGAEATAKLKPIILAKHEQRKQRHK